MNARTVIDRARTYINDEPATAITESRMLGLLNDTLNHISSRSRTIRQGISISVLEGQGAYGLPDEFSQIHSVFFRDYRGLVELTQAELDDNVILSEYADWGPSCYDTWEKAKVANDVVAISAVDTDASTFTYVPTTGAIKVGDEIHNSTDSESFSTVTAVSKAGGETTVTHGDVIGETRDYEVDDVVRIVNPAHTNYAIAVSPPPNSSDPVGVESLSVYVTLKHRTMTQKMIDNENDSLEIDSEMFDATVWDLAHRCNIVIQGSTENETLKFEALANQRFWEAYPIVNSRYHRALNLFRKSRLIPRKRHRPIVNV